MSAAVSWGTTLRMSDVRTPHGECDCPECVEARAIAQAKICEARARLAAEVPPIPPRVFELLALAAGIPEPPDPYLRNIARAAAVQRWVELAGEECERAEEELAAALSRAVFAREELVARCEIAEVTLPLIARCVDEARACSPWASSSGHDGKVEEE